MTKAFFRISLLCAILFNLQGSPGSLAQIPIYPRETMYSGTGGMNGDSVAAWESANRFVNDVLYMTGTADLRNTYPSDYPGASGGWNVMLNAAGEYFQIDSIHCPGYPGITLSLGIRKPSNAEDGSSLLIQYCTEADPWTPLMISLPTGPGTTGWHSVLVTGMLPAAQNMTLRISSASNLDFRLDDLQFSGIPYCQDSIHEFYPTTGPAGTRVSILGSGLLNTTQVLFNQSPSPAYQVHSDSLVTALVPSACGTGMLQLITGCSVSGTSPFIFIDSSCALNGTNLIISELCDPAEYYSSDRFIEIFNPCYEEISLDGWSVRAISNFTECETWNLGGSILPGQSISCGYTAPVNGGPHDFVLDTWNAAIPGNCCNSWNGNQRDGAALYCGSQLIDRALAGNNTDPWFSDRSIRRTLTTCSPDTSITPAGWDAGLVVLHAGDFPSSPGFHQTECPGSAPGLSIQPVSAMVCESGTAIFHVETASSAEPMDFRWWYYQQGPAWLEVQENQAYSVTNGLNFSTLTVNNLQSLEDGTQLYCKVRAEDGGCWRASDACSLTIIHPPPTSAIYHY